MKRNVLWSSLLVGSLLLTSSCTDSEGVDNGPDIVYETITLNADYTAPEAEEVAQSSTRTELQNDVPWWSVNDQLCVISKIGTKFTAQTFTNKGTEPSRKTTFEGQIATGTKRLFSFYPFKELKTVGQEVTHEILSVQYPKRNGFDGQADILISKVIQNPPQGTFDGSTLNFDRMGAVVKVIPWDKDNQLKGEHVLDMTIKHTDLAGEVVLDLMHQTMSRPATPTAVPSIKAVHRDGQQYIIQDAETPEEDGTYFIVYPQTLASGTELTISGVTDNKTFSKTITLKNAINLDASALTILDLGLFANNITKRTEAEAWRRFITPGATDNVLLDFSYAGYHRGEIAPSETMPAGYTEVLLDKKLGFDPTGGVSSRQAFIDVLNAHVNGKANANVVLRFPEGTFILHDKNDDVKGKSSEIFIEGGHFIIKGAGRDKTILDMADPNQPNSDKLFSSPDMILIKNNSGIAKTGIEVSADALKGSFSIRVSQASSSFTTDEWVCLYLETKEQVALDYELGGHGWENWMKAIKEQIIVKEIHQIKNIQGNTVTFYEPIMRDVNTTHGTWTLRKFNCYEEVGVEDLTFRGRAKENFTHHASWEDDGAFKPITFTRLVNSWIRRVNFESVSECMTFAECANSSAYDIEVKGNRGHAGLRSSGSSRIFLGKIWEHSSGKNIEQGQILGSIVFEDAGQYHASGVAKPSIGAVLWRNHWGKDSTFESHSSQPRATLVDHCRGGWVEWRFGGDKSQTPNHLNDLTIWNFENERFYGRPEQKGNYQWWDTTGAEKWRVVNPIIVGFYGLETITFDKTKTPDKAPQMKYLEGENAPVYPESLYEAQLIKRLGHLPQWLIELKSVNK